MPANVLDLFLGTSYTNLTPVVLQGHPGFTWELRHTDAKVSLQWVGTYLTPCSWTPEPISHFRNRLDLGLINHMGIG